jgi:hypothetical protein
LIALASGGSMTRALAQDIVAEPAASPEYGNGQFLDQLVYASLMALADPTGVYSLDNQQLQSLLADLAGAITAPDATSAAIKASLLQHGKVLFTDASYPMVDPYNPAVGFDDRGSDTRRALDAARARLAAAHGAAKQAA